MLAAPLYDKLPTDLKEAVGSRRGRHAGEVTLELRGMLAKGARGAVEKWKRDAGPEAAKLV